MPKKVVLITQGLSLVVKPLLEQQYLEIVGITESAPRNYNPRNKKNLKIKKRVIDFIRSTMRPSNSLSNLASIESIPYFWLHKGNSREYSIWLQQLEADIVVIYSMSQLLPSDILDIPNLVILNLHPSLLPAYRGPNPWFWMYYNMERIGGITLHYVDSGEDTGDIIFQKTYKIPQGIKLPELQKTAIGKYGVEMMLDAIKLMAQGDELPRRSQSKKSTTKRARNIEIGEQTNLIDWNTWPIEQVWHVMSGTELWLNCVRQPSGIYTGQKWRVLGFERIKKSKEVNNYGLISKDKKGFFVQCRDGIIRLDVRINLISIARFLFSLVSK